MTYNENLDVCPITKETWEKRAEEKSVDCGGQSVYHCLADNEGRKWERCVEKSLIKEGICHSALFKRFNNRNDLFPSLLILKFINYSHDRSFYRLLSHLYK